VIVLFSNWFKYLLSLLLGLFLSHLLLNDLCLLPFSDSSLRSIDFGLCRIELSHHFEDRLLLPHHLFNDLIEELV